MISYPKGVLVVPCAFRTLDTRCSGCLFLEAVKSSANGGTLHYDDVIMSTIASQITSLTIVYSTVYSGADKSKHQSSASLDFVWGIHRGPVNSPHKWPVTRKMFPFDDVIMTFVEVYRSLQWRHYECDGVSSHGRLDCLLNRLFRRRSKKASKLRITGLGEGNPPVTVLPHLLMNTAVLRWYTENLTDIELDFPGKY